MKKLQFLVSFVIGGFGFIYPEDVAIELKQDVSAQDLIFQEMQQEDIDNIKILFEKNLDIPSYTAMDFDFAKYLNDNKYKVYICKDKATGSVIAFLVGMKETDSFYVRALGVDKNYRRYGLATKLLKLAHDFAEQNDYKALTICASNDRARSCYEKFGFKKDPVTIFLTIAFRRIRSN